MLSFKKSKCALDNSKINKQTKQTIPIRKLICINKMRFVTDNLLYELEIHRKSSPFYSRPKFDIDWLNRDKRFSRISHRKRFIHIPWYAVFAVPNDRKSSIDAKYDERTIYTKYDAVYGTGNFGIILNIISFWYCEKATFWNYVLSNVKQNGRFFKSVLPSLIFELKDVLLGSWNPIYFFLTFQNPDMAANIISSNPLFAGNQPMQDQMRNMMPAMLQQMQNPAVQGMMTNPESLQVCM